MPAERQQSWGHWNPGSGLFWLKSQRATGQAVALCHCSVCKAAGGGGESLWRNLGWVQMRSRGREGCLCFLGYLCVKSQSGWDWCFCTHTDNMHYSTALWCWVRTNPVSNRENWIIHLRKRSFKHTLGLYAWMLVLLYFVEIQNQNKTRKKWKLSCKASQFSFNLISTRTKFIVTSGCLRCFCNARHFCLNKKCLRVALNVNELHWQLVLAFLLLLHIIAAPSNKTNIYTLIKGHSWWLQLWHLKTK